MAYLSNGRDNDGSRDSLRPRCLERMTCGMVSLFPLFTSGVPRLWLLGAVSFLTFLVSHESFPLTFISVWCLLAAVSSVVLWFVIKNYGETPPPRHADVSA